MQVHATSLRSTRAAEFRRRLWRAVREVANAYDLFLILVLLLQANKNAKKGQKSGTSVTEALSNSFVLFLVLVLLQLGFDT